MKIELKKSVRLDQMKEVIKNIIKSTTDTVLSSIRAHQEVIEKQTNDRFDSLNEEIATLIRIMGSKTSTTTGSNVKNFSPRPSTPQLSSDVPSKYCQDQTKACQHHPLKPKPL